MNKFYRLVKSNVITILIISISLFAIYYLYNFIFWEYPNFIRGVFHNNSCPLEDSDISYNIGTFGDMYGGLNAFLSGLAFVGAVIAIILQVYQIYQERRKREDEVKVQLNLFKWHLEKLKKHYLKKLEAYLNWNGVALNFFANQLNVNDDYSFKEILNMNTLDLYKGFIKINLNQQTDILIEFIINLKEVHEDYLSARNFKKEYRTLIKDFDNELIKSGSNLRERLIELGHERLANNILSVREHYLYDFGSSIINQEAPDIVELLESLPAYKEYLQVLEKDLDIKWYESENSNKLDRIFELNKLIENLINGIPNLTMNVVGEL